MEEGGAWLCQGPCLSWQPPLWPQALSREAETSRASSLLHAHSPFPHITLFQPRTGLQWEFPFLLLLKYTVINKLILLTATTRK